MVGNVITYRAGHGTKTFKSNSNAFIAQLTKDLRSSIEKVTQQFTREGLLKAQKRVEAAANRELDKLMPYVTGTLIGQTGTTIAPLPVQRTYYRASRIAFVRRDSGVRPVAGRSLHWEHLALKTIKAKKKNKHKIFLHQGPLRTYLRNNAARLIARTGKVKVRVLNDVKKLGDRATVYGSLEITMAPNVYPGTLPALKSGNWTDHSTSMAFERFLKITDRNIEKLRGKKVHRPLLQPMFAYWYLHRVPQAVSAAILKELNA